MRSLLKTRIGLALAAGYLLLVVLTLLDVAGSQPDAMSGLAPMFLTIPWSFWLAENLRESSLTALGVGGFYLLLFVSAIPNAVILYMAGIIISAVVGSIKVSAQK